MATQPPSVRILPMSTDEFSDWSIEEIQQQFFLHDFPSRPNGRYQHYKYGLKAPPGTVVLFQYRNVLVASAVFRESERFIEPDNEGYEGALYFDTNTIRVFEPVDAAVVCQIWVGFKRFSHVKQSLDPGGYAMFERDLRLVKSPRRQQVNR